MTTSETSRYVRLRVDLVLEIENQDALCVAALMRIGTGISRPADESTLARIAAREDGAEALLYLVQPVDLIYDIPGIGLAQASWTSEWIDYDPDSLELYPDEDDAGRE
ncbi:hypothetical protein [Streptomyces sp. ITFR-6]|uniref:hypothetical protein n=1 Tax=Streptomyces sp. ITFR-6 TaxID=3075197 RepID=UPI00288B875E|nr:hypothetical protein [Streptomyces sp. ITFR-6]WNI28029.1 hypothetical protein RLT59_04005 [Streptomyces sp. ITFR-6]